MTSDRGVCPFFALDNQHPTLLDMAPTHGFARPNFSWQTYDIYRPSYPASLFDLILDYEKRHARSTPTAAHDIGAGSALASSVLAHHHARLLVSDPVPSNVDAARRNLTSTAFLKSLDEAGRKCEVQIEQRAGEDQSWVADGSLDLVTAFEALHWMDAESVVQQAWRTLKGNGVAAFVYYCTKPFIARVEPEISPNSPQDVDVEKANDLLSFILRTRLKKQNSGPAEAVNTRGYRACAGGLDFVGFPEDEWTDVERYDINVGEGAASWGAWRDIDSLPSKVKSEGKKFIDNVEDWSKLVESDWFHGYFDSLQLGIEDLAEDDEVRVALRDLDRCIGTAQVRVTWPVAVVFAARIP